MNTTSALAPADAYAIHLGVLGQIPTHDTVTEIDHEIAHRVGRDNAYAFANGDSFGEWGDSGLWIDEHLATIEISPDTTAPGLAYVSGHLCIYVRRGTDPVDVWAALHTVLAYTNTAPLLLPDGYTANAHTYPFYLSDAVDWSIQTDPNNLWRNDTTNPYAPHEPA